VRIPLKATAVGVLFALVGAGTVAAGGGFDGRDIRDGSLTGADFRNRSLEAGDLRGLRRGHPGAPGRQGAPGPPGAPAELGKLLRVASTVDVVPGTVDAATAECPHGYGVVGGGVIAIPSGAGHAKATVYFSDSLSSPNSWSAGAQLLVPLGIAILRSPLTAVAYCAPLDRPLSPAELARARKRTGRRIDAAVRLAERRAVDRRRRAPK
jgi:hypothetical protein